MNMRSYSRDSNRLDPESFARETEVRRLPLAARRFALRLGIEPSVALRLAELAGYPTEDRS